MTRPKSDKARVRIGHRIPAELLDRIEAYHREHRERLAVLGNDRWTMTDSIERLLDAGLRAKAGDERVLGTP